MECLREFIFDMESSIYVALAKLVEHVLVELHRDVKATCSLDLKWVS